MLEPGIVPASPEATVPNVMLGPATPGLEVEIEWSLIQAPPEALFLYLSKALYPLLNTCFTEESVLT